MDTRSSFGTRIRQLRKERRLTQRQLAEQIGIDFTYLSKIENDMAPAPTEAVIRRIAEVFAETAEDLILLANKLPQDFEQDLLNRPEGHVAGLYRSLSGRHFTDDEWKEILDLMNKRGSQS